MWKTFDRVLYWDVELRLWLLVWQNLDPPTGYSSPSELFWLKAFIILICCLGRPIHAVLMDQKPRKRSAVNGAVSAVVVCVETREERHSWLPEPLFPFLATRFMESPSLVCLDGDFVTEHLVTGSPIYIHGSTDMKKSSLRLDSRSICIECCSVINTGIVGAEAAGRLFPLTARPTFVSWYHLVYGNDEGFVSNYPYLISIGVASLTIAARWILIVATGYFVIL